MFPKINKKRKSRNILIVAAAFFLIFAFVSVHSVHALSFPSGISNYVALNISNSQSSATPNPFQQMINVTSSDNGWTYINTNQTTAFGENVEFFYANGTIIPSWLEQYHSGYAIWWVKTGSIAANSKITIYMGFASKTTNLFNNKTTGEAPQLSSTYAEYDDGANVFTNYWNFAGTALPTGWTSLAQTDVAITVDNGITVNNTDTTSTSLEQAAYYSTEVTPSVEDFLVTSSSFGNRNVGVGYTTSTPVTTAPPPNTVEGALGSDTNNTRAFAINSTGDVSGTTGAAVGTSGIVSTIWTNSSAVTATYNYGDATTETTDVPTYGSAYIVLMTQYSTSYTLQWLRTRAYPPNGVMSSVTFGSVQSIAITLYLNGVSDANTSITYGTESNFTAVSLNNYISLYVNGTKVVSLTQGKAVYLKTLAAGLYKVTAATNAVEIKGYCY